MKSIVGVVVSAKMKKTVVVRTETSIQHPVYRKYVNQRMKVKARDEMGCSEGDVVRIVPIRPVSKNTCWRVTEIVGKKAVIDRGEEEVAASLKGGEPGGETA